VVLAVGLAITLGTALSGCGGDDTPPPTDTATGVRVLPSTSRVGDWVPASEYTDAIALETARGESEGAQLVVSAGDSARKLTVTLAPITGPHGASLDDATVYHEHALGIDEPSPLAKPGTYFDGLAPVTAQPIDVAAGQSAVFWVDVHTPRDAAPGTYTSTVKVTDGATALGTVDMTVRVRNVTLPKEPTLASSVGIDPRDISEEEGVTEGSRAGGAMIDRYYAALAKARLSPVGVAHQVPAPGDADDGSLVRVYDREGVASRGVPLTRDWPFPDPLGADRPAALQYLRDAAAYFRGHGWLDSSYVFIYDEPTPAEYENIKGFHELLREADPALRLLVPNTIVPEIDPYVDIWSVNVSPRITKADIDDQHGKGREYWWYPSVSTHHPYPTIFIDEQRDAPRALGWLAWRNNVDGFTFWSTTRWTEVDNPWEDPATFHVDGAVANGDGTLMYPGSRVGSAGPQPSVRLLQLRDGFEDHDLMVLAERARGTRFVEQQAKLLAPSLTEFTSSGAAVAAARARWFDAIDG
jgi:hypothetical protein